MADNVAITAGAGTTIATQDEAGVHYQEVKLVASGTGTTAALTKAEDAAHTDGDHGIVALAVRRDTAAVGSGTDGDYSTINVNSAGRVYTSSTVDAALPAGDNNIGNVDIVTAPGNITDDAAFTVGTTGVQVVGGTYRATPDAVDANDGGAFHMTARRAIHASLRLESDGTELGGEAGAPLWVAISSGGVELTPGTEYTENDAITADAGKGTLMIARRDDTLSTLTPVEGDAVGLRVNSTGALWVAFSGSASTTQYAEDAAHVSGDQVVVCGAVRRDTVAVGSGTDGDYSTLNVNSSGRLYTASTIDAALPAGTNLVGKISAGIDTASIYEGATALTPKFASIDAATSGDNTLISAVASKKIRVLALFIVAAGTVNARFESGTGGTPLTGQMNLVANTGFVLPFSPVGWFETGTNTLLNLELSAAVSVDGSIVYAEVS